MSWRLTHSVSTPTPTCSQPCRRPPQLGECDTLDKRGRDGSGKANIVRGDGGEVWGALYRMDPEHWRILDQFEGGYERVGLDVASAGGVVRATSYTSSIRTPDAVAFDWYQQLILDGAREHGLPEDWIAGLLALPVRSDPSRD